MISHWFLAAPVAWLIIGFVLVAAFAVQERRMPAWRWAFVATLMGPFAIILWAHKLADWLNVKAMKDLP